MSTTAPPMNLFDVMAGAKASYETFCEVMGITTPNPWEELTQKQQDNWVKIIKAGIRAAKETRSRKASRRLLYSNAAHRVASFGRLDHAVK